MVQIPCQKLFCYAYVIAINTVKSGIKHYTVSILFTMEMMNITTKCSKVQQNDCNMVVPNDGH